MHTQRMEQDTVRLAQTLQASRAQATVRTRSFGFSMGGFGLDYTTRDVELPAEVATPAPTLRGKVFSDTLDAATILRTAADDPGPQGDTPLSADQALSRRKAHEAYALASLNQHCPTPGRLGSV